MDDVSSPLPPDILRMQAWPFTRGRRSIPGDAYGCRYPSLAIHIRGDVLSLTDRERLLAVFREAAPEVSVNTCGDGEIAWPDSAAWLLARGKR